MVRILNVTLGSGAFAAMSETPAIMQVYCPNQSLAASVARELKKRGGYCICQDSVVVWWLS
jgi:hypothetical protein